MSVTWLPILWSLLKFCLVGGSGMVVDFGVTWLCKERLLWNKYVSNSLGFVLAATNNYVWNRLWTFASHDTAVVRQYSMFLLVAVIGLALNNLIIYLLHERLRLNFYVAKICAIICVTLWNFSMNYLFTFGAHV